MKAFFPLIEESLKKLIAGGTADPIAFAGCRHRQLLSGDIKDECTALIYHKRLLPGHGSHLQPTV